MSKVFCVRLVAALALLSACGVDEPGTSSGPPVVGGEDDFGLDFGFSVPTDAGTSSDEVTADQQSDALPDESNPNDMAEDVVADSVEEDLNLPDETIPDVIETDLAPDAVDLGLDAPFDIPLDLPDLADLTPDIPVLCDLACDDNERCQLTDAGPQCVCNPGFERRDDGTCVYSGPPWLVVDPESIDFGNTGLNVSNYATLTITNHGDEAYRVYSVELESTPSSGFRIFSNLPFPIDIAAGDSYTVEVRFRPTLLRGGDDTPYGNTVVVSSNDPTASEIEVPLQGLAVPNPEYCLNWQYSVYNLGLIEPEEDPEEVTVQLYNCGSQDLSGVSVHLVDDSLTSDLTVSGDVPTIGAGNSIPITLTYEPTTWQQLNAIVVAEAEHDLTATMLVRSEVTCPEADIGVGLDDDPIDGIYFVEDGETVALTGDDSDDPTEGDLLYDWAVSGPTGETGFTMEPSFHDEDVEFTPEVPGFYKVALSVESERSGLASCNLATVEFAVYPSDPHVRIELTWDNWADLDLHTIRSDADGAFGEFGRRGSFQEAAAYWDHLSPDWGVSTDTTDDPWMLGDDRDGYGPEIILIPSLEAERDYKIGINYADRRGTARVTAHLEIQVGEEETEIDVTLEASGMHVPAIIHGDGEVELLTD